MIAIRGFRVVDFQRREVGCSGCPETIGKGIDCFLVTVTTSGRKYRVS